MDARDAVVFERTTRALDALLPGAAQVIHHALRTSVAGDKDAEVLADLVANARVVLDGAKEVVAQAVRATDAEELLGLARHEVTVGEGQRALLLVARALEPEGTLTRMATGLGAPDRRLVEFARAWVAAALVVMGRSPEAGVSVFPVLPAACAFLPRPWGMAALAALRLVDQHHDRRVQDARREALLRAAVAVAVLECALRQCQAALRELLEAVLHDFHTVRTGSNPAC